MFYLHSLIRVLFQLYALIRSFRSGFLCGLVCMECRVSFCDYGCSVLRIWIIAVVPDGVLRRDGVSKLQKEEEKEESDDDMGFSLFD